MDAAAKKTALRKIPYAIYVLGTKGASGEPNAAIVSWCTQCSFEPPLIALGLKKDSKSHAFVTETGAFALNLLTEDQKDVAVKFFKDSPAEDGAIAGMPFKAGTETGAPIFPDLAGFLECRVVETVARGDHTLFVAEVVEAGMHKEGEPLTHKNTGWAYGG